MALFWRRHAIRDDELSAYADGELDETHRARVESHVDECSACRETLAELRAVSHALSALPRAEAPRSFALREADVSPAPRQAAMPLGRAPAFLGSMAAFAIIAFGVLLGVDLNDGSSTPTADLSPASAQYEVGADASSPNDEASEIAAVGTNERSAEDGESTGPRDSGTPDDFTEGLAPSAGDAPDVSVEDGDAASPDLAAPAEPRGLPGGAEPEGPPPQDVARVAERDDDGPNLRAAEAAAAALAIVALGSLALVWWRRRSAA